MFKASQFVVLFGQKEDILSALCCSLTLLQRRTAADCSTAALHHCRGERPLRAAMRSVNRPVQYKQRVNCVNCVNSGGPPGRTARKLLFSDCGGMEVANVANV